MSYILVTYGYNQFSLFNIKTSTPTLIDKIKEVSFQNIITRLQSRDGSLQKELDSSVLEEDKLKKALQQAESDLQAEEDKYQEAVRQLEAKKKREEMEQKKKEAAAAKNEPKAKGKKEEKKSQDKKKPDKNDPKKPEEPGIDDKPITDLKEKIAKINEDLNVLANHKNINLDKRAKVQEYLVMYRKKFKERMNIKIDLGDSKGEKININSKGDSYANEYLVEKTVYELNSFNMPSQDNKIDSKKNTKNDFKKDNKKKGENKENKDNKEAKEANKEEPKEIELVLEPVKIDGYCFRTIKEDEELEDGEKAQGKDKKPAKKK